MSAAAVVLGPNIVLSALLFKRGRYAIVREAWPGGRNSPLVSQATVAELMRALGYPELRLSEDDRRELLADYLPFCLTVRMPAKLPMAPVCRTPSTCHSAAREGRAVPTGSSPATRISSAWRREFSCPIVTGKDFSSRLREEEDASTPLTHDIVQELPEPIQTVKLRGRCRSIVRIWPPG